METVESFGIIPLKKEDDCWKILIVKNQSGRWSFPKGRQNHTFETPRETAERELKEETGLSIENYLSSETFFIHYPMLKDEKTIQKKVTFFVAIVTGKMSLCPIEIEEALWVSIENLHEKIIFNELITQLQKLLQNY